MNDNFFACQHHLCTCMNILTTVGFKRTSRNEGGGFSVPLFIELLINFDPEASIKSQRK